MRRLRLGTALGEGLAVEGGPDDVGLVLEAVGRAEARGGPAEAAEGDGDGGVAVDPEGDRAAHAWVPPRAGLEDVEGEAEHAALHLGVEDVGAEVRVVAALGARR